MMSTPSVSVVDNQSVADVYARLASVYDWLFGLPLQPGRIAAIRRSSINPGDRVLEVGIGTGINAPLYPSHCDVTGIDLSAPMLERAARRLAALRIHNVHLLQMDAANLQFPDQSFDVVYAPYLISVVPDPIKVVREMHRVCRRAGRIVLLNHFLSNGPIASFVERRMAPLAIHLGFKPDLDMRQFLADANLDPLSIERVNRLRLWSLVTCSRND